MASYQRDELSVWLKYAKMAINARRVCLVVLSLSGQELPEGKKKLGSQA